MMPQEKGSVRSLGKALELLELLNRSRVPMTLQALSQASGYPKAPSTRCWPPCGATAASGRSRMAGTTWGQSFVRVGLRRVRCVEITPRAVPIWSGWPNRPSIRPLLSPAWRAATSWSSTSGSAATGIQVASEIGGRTPLHATSQGKLLLSQLPDATVRISMNGQGMDPFTPHTIVTLPDLLEELEHIRRKGCAIENGEYKIGLRSVSAPVFDREGADALHP